MMTNKKTLPNSTATLVLGILSVVFCSCFGIPGLILAIIAFAISGNSLRIYRENPDLYYGYSNLKAGRISALVGLIVNGMYIVMVLIILGVFGTAGIAGLLKKIKEHQPPQEEFYEDAGDYDPYEDSLDTDEYGDPEDFEQEKPADTTAL